MVKKCLQCDGPSAAPVCAYELALPPTFRPACPPACCAPCGVPCAVQTWPSSWLSTGCWTGWVGGWIGTGSVLGVGGVALLVAGRKGVKYRLLVIFWDAAACVADSTLASLLPAALAEAMTTILFCLGTPACRCGRLSTCLQMCLAW